MGISNSRSHALYVLHSTLVTVSEITLLLGCVRSPLGDWEAEDILLIRSKFYGWMTSYSRCKTAILWVAAARSMILFWQQAYLLMMRRLFIPLALDGWMGWQQARKEYLM